MEIGNNHIIPYLEGKLPKEEQSAFEEKMCISADFRKEVEDVRYVFGKTELLKQQRKFRTMQNWEVLSRRIERQELVQKIWNFTRTTAAILLLPLLALTSYFYIRPLIDKDNLAELVEVTTASGLISRITLPDSSTVWLNAGSKIVYPREFKNGKRLIQLTGEAYFKVKADQQNRFDVAIKNEITISAYGTEFNVSAYENDNRIEAVLTKGHIEVSNKKSKKKHLNIGQSAILNKADQTTEFKISDTNVYEKTAWKDGKMVFRRAGFDEITKRLSRHFNVEIELRGRALYEYEYSATFTTETLPEILSLLEKSAPITCRIIEPEKRVDMSYEKRKIIITAKK